MPALHPDQHLRYHVELPQSPLHQNSHLTYNQLHGLLLLHHHCLQKLHCRPHLEISFFFPLFFFLSLSSSLSGFFLSASSSLSESNSSPDPISSSSMSEILNSFSVFLPLFLLFFVSSSSISAPSSSGFNFLLIFNAHMLRIVPRWANFSSASSASRVLYATLGMKLYHSLIGIASIALPG